MTTVEAGRAFLFYWTYHFLAFNITTAISIMSAVFEFNYYLDEARVRDVMIVYYIHYLEPI